MKCRFTMSICVWAAFLLASACKRAVPDDACTEPAKDARPLMVADETEFDFGKVKQGAEVEHIFKIKNEGTKDLIIDKTTASCGCVATVATKSPILPGKEGEIKAVFRTQGKRGISSKRITVFSNDPKNPKLALTLKGEVILDVDSVPSSLSFNEIMVGKTATLTAKLNISEPDRVKITSVTSDDPRFAAKVIPGSDPHQSDLEVTFLGSKTQMGVSTLLHVAAEGTDAKGLDLPVRVQVVGNLRYPKQVFLMKVGDVFNTRDIDIVSLAETPFKIKSAVDKDGRVKLDFPKKLEKKVRIVASVHDPKMKVESSIKGTIQVTTSDPVDSKFEIGYTISHRQGAAEIRERVMRAKKSGADRTGSPNAEDDTDRERQIPII